MNNLLENGCKKCVFDRVLLHDVIVATFDDVKGPLDYICGFCNDYVDRKAEEVHQTSARGTQ